MNRARLLLLTNNGEITQEFVVDQPNIIIGRSPQSNVIIDNGDVSRAHAQIVSTPNGFFVSDMGSTNGTFLNGAAIKAKQMFQLKSNDQVNLGNVSLMFQIVPETFPNAETAIEPDYNYNSTLQNTTVPAFEDEYSYNHSLRNDTLSQEAALENYHQDKHFQEEFPFPNTQSTNSSINSTAASNMASAMANENFHPYNSNSFNTSSSQANIAPETISLEEAHFAKANSTNTSYANSSLDSPSEQFNQPTYIPPILSNSQTGTNYQQSSTPNNSLSDEELKLAMEIFGEEKNKSKTQKNEAVKWTGWDKSGLFQQKQTPSQPTKKSTSNEVSEDELFKQVFGSDTPSSSFIPNNAFDEPLANKEINFPQTNSSQNFLVPSQSSLQRAIPKEQKVLLPPNQEDFLFASSFQEQNSITNELSEQASPSQEFTVDTESYYYPTARTNNENLFQKENYSYDDKQTSEEDPFNALKYSEEDSIFAKFKNPAQPTYSAEELKEKLRKETKHQVEAKPNLQTIIKNYALPIGLIVGAVVFAVFMYFRNSGLFG